MKVTTIGFTKKSARRLLGLRRGSRVKRIVDVRLNNGSQLAGFAKKDDLAWFAREVVEPGEAAWDEAGRVPAAAFREAAGRGLRGLTAPEALGGRGLAMPAMVLLGSARRWGRSSPPSDARASRGRSAAEATQGAMRPDRWQTGPATRVPDPDPDPAPDKEQEHE